jgi:hypothetical protein
MVGTWSAFPLGTLNDDGYQISATTQGQEVNETDAFGMTLVEAIYRGINWRCKLRCLEWKTGLINLWLMFGQQGASGTLSPTLANIGNRWTLFCQPLILTAILANPPTAPQSLTATNAGVAPQQQTEFNATSKVKEVPLELCLIPYATVINSTTFNVPFTVT